MFHGSSSGQSRGGFCFVLTDEHFQAFSLALFFVMEITLHFVCVYIYIKIFFLHRMCLTCFENCWFFIYDTSHGFLLWYAF